LESVQLRSYIILDSLQPQFAAYSASIAQGNLPIEGEAALYLEVSPGMQIHRLMDKALKTVGVVPAYQVIERRFGLLEVHAPSQADVRQAGATLLDVLGQHETDRMRPRILAKDIIRNIDSHQAMLINREDERGMMVLPRQTLFVLEMAPAGYAVYAANEALKAADVNLVRVRATGAYGRVYLAGEEAEVMVASEAAIKALEGISGVAFQE
jgi:hypothetical protein